MNILFCTDGSKTSYGAIDNFSKWINKENLVDIVSVADWSFAPDFIVSEGGEQLALKCSSGADDVLKYSQEYVESKGLNFNKTIKMCGSTVDSILEAEEQNEYDIIVLGSNGKKGFQKWLGSVSQEIASLSKTSSYISKNKNFSNKILYPLDITENSIPFLEKSIKMLNLSEKQVELMTVFEIPEYLFMNSNQDENWINDIKEKFKERSIEKLEEYEKLFNNSGIKIETKIVLEGKPAETIIKYANLNETDLIVTNTKNRKPLSRRILGTINTRILENVKSDMLIIH